MKRTNVLGMGLVGLTAFVLGFGVGGTSNRAEMRELQDELQDARRANARAGVRSGFATALATGMASNARSEASPASRTDKEDTTPSASRTEPVENTPKVKIDVEVDTDATDADEHWIKALEEGDPAERSAALADAKDAMDVRLAQTRAALIDDVDPSDDQLADIDAATDDMNQELRDIAEEFVRMAEGDVEPSRRDVMAMTADIMNTLVSTEDRMLETLSAEQITNLQENSTDPTAYIDPELLDYIDVLVSAEQP